MYVYQDNSMIDI